MCLAPPAPPNTFVLNSVNHGYTSLLRRASWRGQSCDGPGGLLAPPQPREKTQGLRGVRPGTQATQLRRAGLASLWGDLGGGGLPSSCTTFRTLPTHHGILDKSPPLSDGVSGEIRKEGTGAKAQAFVPRGRGMRRLPPMGPQEETAGWSGQVACRAGCLQGFGKGPGNPKLVKHFVQRGQQAAWAGVIHPQPPPRCCWRAPHTAGAQ